MSKKMSRRTLLAGVAGTVGGATVRPVALAHAQIETTRVPGPGPSDIGARSQFEQPRRDPSATSSRTPLQDLYGTITPSDLHFERHHAGIPRVDLRRYKLVVHGLVEKSPPPSSTSATSSDSRPRHGSVSWSARAISGVDVTTSRHSSSAGSRARASGPGVMLATLLREVGAHDTATWCLAEGQDAAVMSRSIPMEKALDDAMIAYAQNGEPLRPEQGIPRPTAPPRLGRQQQREVATGGSTSSTLRS